MKFSLVIPLYNKAPYIESAIASVLAQTFQDFEIIVLDDGSTDGGADLVAAIADPRVRLFRQANAGVSATRNRGISMANGQWVAFLDADDWHHPEYLQSLVLAQNLHPTVDVVATQYIPVPGTTVVWPPAWRTPATPVAIDAIELIEDLPSRWMKGPTFTTSSVCIRTTRLQQMQPCFVVGESHGEDLDMWFRVAEQSPVAWVKRPLVAYRVSVEGSLSVTNPKMELAPFLHRIRARALSGAMTDVQAKSALKMVADQEISMARDALASGQRMEAIRLLWRGHNSASKKRWWFTAAMTVFVPGELVKRWQHWRVRRAIPTMSAG
jgi:glycosyltransferase involved in cell wall biosynthesis